MKKRKYEVKKVWNKPKLVVLFRGKPEEAVLQVCKMAEDGIGADNNFSMCYSTRMIACTASCDAIVPT